MTLKPNHSLRTEQMKRKKRSLAPLTTTTWVTIETAIFVDAYLYKHMAQENFPDDVDREMTHFVLTMMNAVISMSVYNDHPVSLRHARLTGESAV